MTRGTLSTLIAVLVLIFCLPAWALRFEATERQITSNPADQTHPAISGPVIIWTDYRNGNTDIYLFDLETGSEVQVTNDLDNQYLNDVSGNHAVFTTYLSGDANEEIFSYDIASGQVQNITNHWADQRNPSISGSVVVFQDSRNRTNEDLWDIFWVDLNSSAFLPAIEFNGSQVNPQVSGNLVVWEDLRNDTDLDIYLMDLSTGQERLIAGGPGHQRYPHIDGDVVVYNNGYDDIWAYRISTGETFAITNTPQMERIPVVSGDYVAFERWDEQNGDMDIWLYSLSLGAEVQATIDPANQYLQDLDGNRLVYVDDRNGNLDIYLVDFILDEPQPVSPCDDPQAATVFGPKVYVRGTGKPTTILDGFAGLQLGGEAYICIANGNPEGNQRVTSAWINLNGQQVAGPENFGEDVPSLEIPVEIRQANLFAVKLAGAPGSNFTLRVVELPPAGDGVIYTCATSSGRDLRPLLLLGLLAMAWWRRRR